MKRINIKEWFQFDKQKFKQGFKSRAFRVGGYSTTACIVVAAIAIAAVLIVNALPSSYTKLDITANKMFSLSEQTETILKNLDREVDFYLIAQEGSEDANILEFLDRYKEQSDKVKVSTVDPVLFPNFTQQYTDTSVSENSVLVVCGERSYVASYFDIYEQDYSNYNTTGTYAMNFAGENVLTKALDYVTSDNLPTAYVLTGHGEQKLGSSMTSAIASQNFDTEDLSLLSANAVPDDASCLIIVSPARDISANEKDMIINYLDKGGNLLLFTDYTGADMPNLTAVTEYYGVKQVDGIVVEGDANHCLSSYNHYLLPNVETHTITAPLVSGGYYVLMPSACGIVETGSARQSVSIAPLLTTSDSAYSKIKGSQMTTYNKEEGDIDGPFYLGVAITDTIDDNTKASIVWFSTSNMMLDEANSAVSGANTDIVINALGWMCGHESSISIHTKSLDGEKLTIPSVVVTRLSLILVVILPLACIAAGIIVWARRKRK